MQQNNSTWGKYSENLLRVIAVEWDDEFIYCKQNANGQKLKVCYSSANNYLTRDGKGDWLYLKEVLSHGSRLHLVRIRIKDEVLYPELIIFEPDILINITAIASCFDEAYKESPFVNLLDKLRVESPSIPLHLGNLAGQFLDETVHGADISFKDSFQKFFKRFSLKLIACKEMTDPRKVADFYDNAKQQKENIKKLIGQRLPNEVEGYNPRMVLLEPTFFSEVLGIQGRLDMLFERGNKTYIIEQKSGKGAYVNPRTPGYNPDIPKIVVKHWVQLILYRALFIYEFQKYADQLQQIFLLYSKYSEGLVNTGISPDLLLRAIRIRNLLAWSEMYYAQKGFSLLSELTPDSFRSSSVSDRFWDTWKVPAIKEILDPIHQSSPLERAYYFRFLRFVAMEHLLSKVGSRTKDDYGFSTKWLASLEEKKDAGDIYDTLTLESCEVEDEEVTSVVFRFDKSQSVDMTNFRQGDIVLFYQYHAGQVPDACAQMVHRASIVSITNNGIKLKLRNSQADRHVFDVAADTLWAIEHDLFEASSSSLYQGLQRFLTATKERRDMILSQRQLRVDTSVALKGEYGTFNTLVLHAKQSRDLFLVIGPPGTGKTSFGLLNILQEELLETDTSILLLSFTNRAVDEICSKLKESDIDFIRIGSELTCDEAYREHLLENKAQHIAKGSELVDLIRSTRVFCGTTAALNSNISLLSIKQFDLAIVDESSQILEPHLIGLLSATHGNEQAIRRFVLIGDHKQLPAVVQQSPEESKVTEPELLQMGLTDCRLSLFERLLAKFKQGAGEYDPSFVYMLTRQGRMHREIARFPNHAFYSGKLDIVGAPWCSHQELVMPQVSESESAMVRILTTRPVAFIHAPLPSLFIADKVNKVEADMIASAVVEIYNLSPGSFDVSKTVGVIVPYRNQISMIRNAIDSYGIPLLHDITIDTVERYQGSQRDYILYGFTIQRPYQLDFLASNTFEEDGMLIDRKLNVAMTRARLHLLMFGNADLLNRNQVFHNLIEYCKQEDCFYSFLPK